MRKIHIDEVPKSEWRSPQGKFGSVDQEISVALGRIPESTDLLERHPFDVEICRVLPGQAACPYHSHSAQWEFYHVLVGQGEVRDANGLTPVNPGDSFIFKPGEAHQILNNGQVDLVFLIVADNPMGESCHYPDSGKWLVRSPERRLMRSENLDYLDGEE